MMMMISCVDVRINAHAGILERNIQLTKLVDNIPDLPPLSALERKLPDQYTVRLLRFYWFLCFFDSFPFIL